MNSIATQAINTLATSVLLCLSFAAQAQYNPNGGYQGNTGSASPDWQTSAAGAAAAASAAASIGMNNAVTNAATGANTTNAAASYQQNASAQFLQSSAPVSSFGQSGTGYTNDGTLMMGGQKIGNPHQVLHDAQVPSFMNILATGYTNTSNPGYVQSTIRQMVDTTIAGRDTTPVIIDRLYLTVENPYAATPTSTNFATYKDALRIAQGASYMPTAANDGKIYVFQTLTWPDPRSVNILIKELPNTSQFKAVADPLGGGVGVRITQNGDFAALNNYLATVKPYDFSWRSALAPYAQDPHTAAATGAFFANWVMGSNQVQTYQANLQSQSAQSGNEAFGVLAWDANQNRYVMLDPTSTKATEHSVSGNMPTLGNNQFGVFGMHTHAGSATPSAQDYLMTQQLGLDQMVVGTNGSAAIFADKAGNDWQGQGFEFEGPIVSNPTYGNTINPANSNVRQGNGLYQSRTGGAHAGIDITSANGASVMAVGSGTVVSTYESTTYGKQVIINHGNGIYSVNSHLDSVSVKVGDKVEAGQEVGTSGITGNTPPKAEPHLHFEIRVGSDKPEIAGGTTANPLTYLPGPYYQNGILVSPNYVSPYVTGPYYTPPTYGSSSYTSSGSFSSQAGTGGGYVQTGQYGVPTGGTY